VRSIRPIIALAAALSLAACGFSLGPAPRPALRSTAQEGFWRRLTQLCGNAYQGRMVEGADSTFVHNRLVMHVRDCQPQQVRIGFIIGPDPSRSWTVRKVPGGLTLTHDVAGERVTGYGGVTRGAGSAERQDFAADTATARMLPPAARNVWSLEIVPGHTFTYGVGRPGVQRRFRLQFDLAHPVAAPSSH
jgi:hypothetical protein